MVVAPHVLVNNPGSARLHTQYYLTKLIVPALQRLLGLTGADVQAWYQVYRHVPGIGPLAQTHTVLRMSSLDWLEYPRGIVRLLGIFYVASLYAILEGLSVFVKPNIVPFTDPPANNCTSS
eukprot:8489254-Pyramimonas_sp.AAC.2